MGRMEETLKSEISRLARKAVNDRLLTIEKENKTLKRQVSGLLKTVGSIEKVVKKHEKHRLVKKLDSAVPEETMKSARVTPLLIKKLRKKLGLSQEKFGKLVGVSLPTIAGWESGKTTPRDGSKQAIVALRKLGRRDAKKLLEQKA